ncbi:MAG: iron ABC transporter permease [Thermoflexia bacterium]|nr:MAG: iron ABC transporter permease [Thermoflexia bacterium]
MTTPPPKRRAGERAALLLVLPATLFLTVFFVLPLARILLHALDGRLLLQAETWGRVGRALGFTVYQAALSTLLTLAVGMPLAFLFARYRFPGKTLWRALLAIPFMLPTVVVAAGFNAFLGDRGWLNLVLMRWLGLGAPPVHFTGTLVAILVAHVFYNTTLVVRLLAHALEHLDPHLEQAARVLGADGGQALRHITLPLLRPSLLAATALVFLFDFTSFGVILLLGGPTFATLEVEIYIQGMHLLNLPMAALLSVIQLLCTFALSFLYSRFLPRIVTPFSLRPAEANIRSPRRWGEKLFLAVMLVLLVALFVVPMASVPLRSVARLEAARGERGEVRYGLTLDYYRELFLNRRSSLFYVPPLAAARNSLLYALATVLLSMALGTPAAIALARRGPAVRTLDALFMLPLGASAVTLGLGFLLVFRRAVTSPWLVPLAHTLIALPLVVRTLQPALASIPPRLREAAQVLGASPWRAWWTVEWPILWRASLAAATFAFTVSLGEFGATLLLARPEYPTLPVAIYRFLSQPGGLNYGQAMAMTTILMAFTAGGILLIERLRPPAGGEF